MFSLALASVSWGSPSDTPFKVLSFHGDIEYRARKSRSVILLRVHHLLEPSGRLRLEEGELIVLESLRGDIITFKNDSYIKLTEYQHHDGETQTLIDVYRGHGTFKVNKLSDQSNFKVRTPRFLTSVRGTEFSIQDDQVSVTEGEVIVQPTADMETRIPISTGQTAHIQSTGEVEVQTTETTSSTQTTESTQSTAQQEEQVTNEVSQQQEQIEAEQLFEMKVNSNAHD
jgi:hypothetical protein